MRKLSDLDKFTPYQAPSDLDDFIGDLKTVKRSVKLSNFTKKVMGVSFEEDYLQLIEDLKIKYAYQDNRVYNIKRSRGDN